MNQSTTEPFRNRPIIGKLKFALARVQSRYAKLPENQRHGNHTRVQLLNIELRKYHLQCHDWPTFVSFVGYAGISSKALSHLLRYARRQSKSGNGVSTWIFSIEDIQRAVAHKVPFRLLSPHWIHRPELQSTDIGYECHLKAERESRAKRWQAIWAQCELIQYCENLGIKVPLRCPSTSYKFKYKP